MEVAWFVAGCRELAFAFFTYSTPLLCNINSHLNGKQYSHCLIKEACDIIERDFLKYTVFCLWAHYLCHNVQKNPTSNNF